MTEEAMDVSRENQEMAPAELLYVLDLDRTLYRTDVAFDALVEAAGQNGVDKERLKAVNIEVKNSGGSFDVYSYLKERVSKNDLANIKESFLTLTREDERFNVLYDGAKELIGTMKSESIPFVIATFGGQEWQKWKLEAAGLDKEDYIITDNVEKGKWFADEWRQDDGAYAPPFKDEAGNDDVVRKAKLRARHIVLVEDKASAFRGMPPDSLGIWVQHRGEPMLTSQEGEINVDHIIVHSLWDLITKLKMPRKVFPES